MEELIDKNYCHKVKVYQKLKQFIQWLKENMLIFDVYILEKIQENISF